jgi:HK97 family phage portal protein
MPNWFTRLSGGRSAAPGEQKSQTVLQQLVALTGQGEASWSRRGYASLAQEGYMRNPVVHRCVRMLADAATRVPLAVEDNGARLTDHPALTLIRRPNPHQSGLELIEAVYCYLMTAGNAYLVAALVQGELKGLYALRPDRMRVVHGRDGWPEGYTYTAGGRTVSFGVDPAPVAPVLHLKLFHPLEDGQGLAPLDAAQMSLDIHNAAARWNKALLDNAARPSGALVYSVAGGNLTPEQFDRLKAELEIGFTGAANAGRPMVLEGGLDWKTIAMSPRDMDFIEAKNAAARDIALAFGVPPMLLGIPGDLTYANYAEANKAFWRHSVIPLVKRLADDLSNWLAPAFGGALTLGPELDHVEALAEDRAALWKRVGEATFLTDAEKRRMLGIEG